MTEAVLDIGSRRELFVDDFLIERMDGVELRLNKPVPREVALVHDAPWEGNTCCYHTVFRDGDVIRMYYRGSHYDPEDEDDKSQVVCYAESRDGIEWVRPELGLVKYGGSKANNIVWDGQGSHNFAPFRDTNPACPPDEQYKALGSHDGALCAFKSPDAIHWSLLRNEPVITEGKFDSQNLAFWDELRECYVDFHRHALETEEGGVRAIMTCTSADFRTWTDPVWVEFPDVPLEQLYTNAVTPYHRAPHLYVGFPKRFVPGRTAPGHEQTGISDGTFMSSRDYVHFKRWGEAFVRPGLQDERWHNRNNMTAWGILEADNFLPGVPPELAIYSTESYYQGEACRLRRLSLRLDGFVSVNAPLKGGELVTRPITFGKGTLRLNVSTSVAGGVRVEIQDEVGTPLEGYALADSEEIFGDDVDRAVSWGGKRNLDELAGRPVRLRFALADADLYAFQIA